jgi:MarR family transcriptional regulator, lower aerobic nicotinate degradation pathway regulator
MGSHVPSFAGDVRAVLDGLRRIVQFLRASSRDTERRVHLSAAQLFALQQVATFPGASINELAGHTFTHQSSVSVVVQRLVNRRLVAKVISKDDRRRVRLAITDAGRQVLRRSPQPAQERLIAGIASLKPADRQHLVDSLAAISRLLAPNGGPPPMLFEDQGKRGRLRKDDQPAGGGSLSTRP